MIERENEISNNQAVLRLTVQAPHNYHQHFTKMRKNLVIHLEEKSI